MYMNSHTFLRKHMKAPLQWRDLQQHSNIGLRPLFITEKPTMPNPSQILPRECPTSLKSSNLERKRLLSSSVMGDSSTDLNSIWRRLKNWEDVISLTQN